MAMFDLYPIIQPNVQVWGIMDKFKGMVTGKQHFDFLRENLEIQLFALSKFDEQKLFTVELVGRARLVIVHCR